MRGGGKLVLPPCPVIGIGDADNPQAEQLDAIIEPPFETDALMNAIARMPQAAASIVQLLRLLPGLSLEAGLVAESMGYAMLQGSAEHGSWLKAQETPRAASAGRIEMDRQGERLIVTLDRPQAGNAIDRPMRDALYDAFCLANLDSDIERISLRAAGRAFSLGAELAEFGTTTDPAAAHSIRSRTLPARMALRCARKLDVHIQGACVGAGLELAACARRVTADRSAWFQLPELAMGILPGAGGCVSLTHRIGRQRTALMVLSGKRISVRKALEWGLVDAIVDQAD